jgi:hypothetical protein
VQFMTDKRINAVHMKCVLSLTDKRINAVHTKCVQFMK